MDKAESEQEDELYALLEKALSDERLCVSEELIQKTLKGVQDGKKEKPYRRYFRVLRYACAAAAAVFVLILGSRILWQGSLFRTSCEKNAVGLAPYGGLPEGMVQQSDPANEPYWEMSDGIDKVQLSSYCKDIDLDGTVVLESEMNWQMEKITVSEELVEALSSVGYVVAGKEAEYWELTQGIAQDNENVEDEGEDGKQEIISALREMPKVPKVITSATPLYKAVRIQTEDGMLWVLLGEELYLLIE